MHRRIEAGPVLVALGALLLIVSLFLDWYAPGLTAWTAFEVIDLGLAVLAIAAAAGAIGLLAPSAALLERRWLPPLVIAAIVLAAFALLDPPPAAAREAPDTGAWLALAGALVMGMGGVLTFGRVSFAVTVEGRDPRRRVAAYDARGQAGPGSSTAPFNPFADEEASRPNDVYRTRPPLSSRRSMGRRPGPPSAEEDAPEAGADREADRPPGARPGGEGARAASARAPGGGAGDAAASRAGGEAGAAPGAGGDAAVSPPGGEVGGVPASRERGEGGRAGSGRPGSGRAAGEGGAPDLADEGDAPDRGRDAAEEPQDAPRARRRRGSWLESEEPEPAEPRTEEPGSS